MHIGLNLHFLRPEITGGGETYAVQLVRALAAIDQRNQYLLICNRACSRLDLPAQDNFRNVFSPVSASIRPARYAWEQLVLPARARSMRLDLIHSMGYVAPVLSRIPQVVTVPDANWKDLDTMSPLKRRALGYFVSRSAVSADVVITGTNAAAATLSKHLPANRGRIAVIPLGADHLPQPTPDGYERVTRPYVLALSGSLNHKNIPRLVQAFASIKDRIPHSLVIAGNVPTDVRTEAATAGVESRLTWTGYITDQVLSTLFAGAELFVFPSWHEGFGLPLLEAQRFGTPVAAAAIPALIEIANGTAELFDPFSTTSMASAILRVIESSVRRAELANAAHRNAARYTWAATAKATLDIYEDIAASRRALSNAR